MSRRSTNGTGIERFVPVLACVSCVSWALSSSLAADWPTARGNPQRTGCIDNQAGPATPKILWVLKSQDHFLATPVPGNGRLHIAGLGAFNVATLSALPLEASGTPTAIWSRTNPLLKLPVVSSPALVGSKLIFGDGMHQTDGATLHCWRKDGQTLWQLPLPGTLVHLEGAPAVAGNRVIIGGGAAGVICVERDRATLDGRELDEAGIQKVLDEKWKLLLAKYEEDKKKDPDFAVKPNEDQLPKPAPVKVWQVGAEKWHVDAPVNIVGDRVLVTSAFLDKEKVGDRALHCLDIATGAQRWRQPLAINPWGGASVIDQTVIVTGSSISYDTKLLKGAKGAIAAFDLGSGRPLWRKESPGGVVGCAALADGLAICCATDGKVRAFDLASGERRWIYDAKFPLFAPPAVVAGVAYVGDLNGMVHALALGDGKAKWKLDVGGDPAVKAPGMFYAGPVVHGGKTYVATCNLEGPHARQPTAVVCIGSN
jgi:outer membrane protein assembly factor BamB